MREAETQRLPGRKTRYIKQKECHVIRALDSLDQAIRAIESANIEPEALKTILTKARKEISKI